MKFSSLKAALDWSPAPLSPVPQRQAYKAFAILDDNMMHPWECIHGFLGTPNQDDHGLPTPGL